MTTLNTCIVYMHKLHVSIIHVQLLTKKKNSDKTHQNLQENNPGQNRSIYDKQAPVSLTIRTFFLRRLFRLRMGGVESLQPTPGLLSEMS